MECVPVVTVDDPQEAIRCIQEHIDALEEAEHDPLQQYRLWGTMLHIIRTDLQHSLDIIRREIDFHSY
jgi:hypothetical protein